MKQHKFAIGNVNEKWDVSLEDRVVEGVIDWLCHLLNHEEQYYA